MSRPNGYWTKDRCIAEAKKYKFYRNWRRRNESSLQAARKKGWYKEIKQKYLTDKTRSYSKEEVFDKAKLVQRRVDFQKKFPYHYMKALKKGWLPEMCFHMMSNKESSELGRKYRWTEETILKTAKTYKHISPLLKDYPGIWDAIIRLNLKEKATGHMDKYYRKWTKEKLKHEALKYKNKIEFTKKNQGALRQIYYFGWGNELLSHMPSFEEQTTKWTKEKVIEAIKECKTKENLNRQYPGAYHTTKKGKYKLNDLFEKDSLRVEIEILHPKIKKILSKHKIDFLYENRFYFKDKYIIPDFVFINKKTVYILEAKTCGRILKAFSLKELNNQIEKQKTFVKKNYKGFKFIHLLVSELGAISSEKSQFNLSIKELDLFIKNWKYIQIKQDKSLDNIRKTSNKLIKQFKEF